MAIDKDDLPKVAEVDEVKDMEVGALERCVGEAAFCLECFDNVVKDMLEAVNDEAEGEVVDVDEQSALEVFSVVLEMARQYLAMMKGELERRKAEG